VSKHKTHERPAFNCPYCEYECDLTTGMTSPVKPKAGDVSICINCGKAALFTENGVRLPDEEEQKELEDNPQVQMFCDLVHSLNAKRKNMVN
jgi:hypothetical protein